MKDWRNFKLRNKLSPVLHWAALAVAAGLLAGCSKQAADKPEGVPVQVAEAKVAPISRIVSADAVLYPLDQAALTPKISAPVSKFYVVRGAHVRRGQLLATLENKDLAASAIENKGLYEQAQAGYETTTTSALPEEVQKAEFDAQSSKEAYAAQQKVYESRQTLFKQGAIPRKDLDQAQVAATQARQQYELAERHLKNLQAKGQQQALKSASGQLAAAKGKFLGGEAQLSYSQIRSPINGVVTDRPLYPGEVAAAGTPLVTVMDTSQVVARAHIPQTEAALLKKGDTATIAAPGLDAPIEGKVTLVSPALDPNSTTIEVWVQAPNPKEQLKPGTTVKISAVAETVKDAIVVPASALLTSETGSMSVMVVASDSTAQSKDVQVGIKQGELAQIVSGIKAGEQVIQTGAFGLPEKTKVSIEKPAAAETAGDDSKAKDEKTTKDDKEKD